MADTEQVSSTTPNEEPKVEVSQGMGDVKEPVNEAEAKVVEKEISDMAEEPIDTPQEPPMEITDLSSIPSAPEVPPETAPQAPAADSVTSTTEDATEQLTKEAVTEKAAPTAPAHTEEIAAAEPVPKTEEKAPEETTPKVEENHTQEPEVEAPVAAPVVQEPVVEEPVVVSAPPEPVVSAPPEPVVSAPLEPVVSAPPEPAPVVEEPVVVSAPPEPAPVVVEEPVIIAEEPPKVAAPVEEPIVVEPPKVEEPIPVPEPTKVEAPVEEVLPAPTAPSYEPALPAFAPSQILMQFPGENWSSSLLASQDSAKVSMDSDNKGMMSGRSGYDHDLLGGSDDDLPYEMQKNPFQGINLGDGMSTGLSHFEDDPVGGRAAQMSESPTPDLVQYAHDGEMQDSSPFQDIEKTYDPVPTAPEPAMQPFSSSLQFSTATAEDEQPGLPPVLPDILKSSPLNPDKIDSGSSEGSPDLSPVHRRGTESPNIPISLSANNPFTFDSKISLLKEMAEETEAKAKANSPEEEKVTEQSFGAFDLVKETKDTHDIEPPQDEYKDWNPSNLVSAKVADKFECLNFPSGKAREDSDSESPSADSLSPVLEAMAKNPAIFQVESDKVVPEDKEVVEAAEEVSEQEVSSEEFEFVERPPRGAIDEFLETLDSTKFSKTSEFTMDEEPTSHFKQEDHVSGVSSTSQEMSANQSSYLLLTEPGKSSPQRSKAGLELADVEESLFQAPPSQSYTGPAKTTAEKTSVKMPNLNVGSVVDLLYWRDVKTTGVVFGANLLLLFSLTMCSIISVLSYVALALLSVTITFRIYKGILQAIQKSDEGHPFKLYLDKELALSEEMAHKYSDVALARINSFIIELRRLFLVEDLVDSLKFAVFMWILTYIGALFNGLTLLILGLIAVFSCPIVYEKHQTQIDHYLAMVNNQVKDIVGKVQAKVPGLKKKAE
ncbi:reticulon-4-like isoform X1 [Alosa sapidissima]|uniref:reticulon-4-like isoform X1 n=1 Tax=Alosa sapidissima TaxID=34773 RepID=UPI001C0964BC|nr:reticulon-4-like isoform X1 [Alosa sapidissima]